jgi:hypothetical protein
VQNNLERLFSRAKKNKLIPATMALQDYRFQSIGRYFPVGAAATVPGQPVEFPAGAIIISVCMDATEAGKMAADRRGSLDMVRVAFDLPSQDGTLIGGTGIRASCLFGRNGSRQWPEKEVLIPRQGAINITVTNLTLSALDVDVVFNVLIPRT